MSKSLAIILIGAAALANPAVVQARDAPDVQMQKLLAGRVAGAPVDCIDTRFSSSRIIDRKAIVYTVGGTLYVNETRSGADALRDDDILVTRLYGSQLCSITPIELRDRMTGMFRGSVILGKFVPYSRVKPTS